MAGKEFAKAVAGNWIRPVSARPTHEVSDEEMQYDPAGAARLLDIVTVSLSQARPDRHQVENHVLDAAHRWMKTGVATWTQVKELIDPYDERFWSHSESTHHGANDKVAENNLLAVGSSLRLIQVSDLQLHVRREGGFEGSPPRTRVRAYFSFHDTHYVLSLTDPEFEDKYLKKGLGEYSVGNAAMCISLTELFHGSAFRVVASVITSDRCRALNGQ